MRYLGQWGVRMSRYQCIYCTEEHEDIENMVHRMDCVMGYTVFELYSGRLEGAVHEEAKRQVEANIVKVE